MLKRLQSILLVLLLLVCFSTPAYAADSAEYAKEQTVDTIIEPYWTYLSSVTAWMDINSSGNAIMASSISAYSTVTQTRISAYLQRLENGSWVTVKNWSETYNGTSGTWTQSWYVNKGYSYRLRTYYYAYKGSAIVESTSLTTRTVQY